MKTKNRAYYIDSFCADGEHEVFNAASLCMFAHVFDTVNYYGGNHSLRSIAPIVRDRVTNVEYRTIHTLRKHCNTKLRYIVSFLYNLRFLLFAPANVILVYNYTNPLFLKTADVLNKLLRRKILVTCHGEMNWLRAKKCYTSRERWVRSFFLSETLTPCKNIYYLVLGDSILHNLRSLLPFKFQNQFLSVDNPYIGSAAADCKRTDRKKIRIGTIGIPARNKGIEAVLRLAAADRQKKVYEFSINGYLGHIGDKLTEIRAAGIDVPETQEFLSREELSSRIGKLDYALFVYPPEEYMLTASGSILDAINYEKPVLSLRNDYFCYLFEKFGAFGVLFDSVDEMIEALYGEDFILPSPDRFDFKTLKRRLSPESIAVELQNTLRLHNIV